MRVAGKTAKIVVVAIFTMATGVVISLAAFTPPAFAQAHKGSGGAGPAAPPDETIKRKRREEEDKAAKAAMEKIPDSKVKYDPWKIER